MECKPSDSKKLCKVFDASKRSRRKKNNLEDSSESDGSKSLAVVQKTAKPQLDAEISIRHTLEKKNSSAGSSSGASPPRAARHAAPRTPHSPRKRDKTNISLALKQPGFVSTPRSESPEATPRSELQQQEGEAAAAEAGADPASCIYDFLEEALKRKKHKQHSRRREGRSPVESSLGREHRHRRRARKEDGLGHTELLQTFVKMCSQAQEPQVELQRQKSNKSLQCDYIREYSDIDRHPTRLLKEESPRDIHSVKMYSRDKMCESGTVVNEPHLSRKEARSLNTGRYAEPQRHSQELEPRPTRSSDYLVPRVYDERISKERLFERELRNKYYDERSSKDRYVDRNIEDRRWTRDEKPYRERNYDDRYVDRRRRYEDRERVEKDYGPRCSPRRKPDRKSCALCRDSEREDRRCYEDREPRSFERDSALSVIEAADSLPSVHPGSERFASPTHSSSVGAKNRSQACKEVVTADPAIKQEVAEQREALDKMMKLWQELMSRFKDVAENMGRSERTVQETAAAARESAAAQAQLWRECMQRYDTVARDVGDTDARLKEELQKQKAEMSEMSGAWQECLARYKELSTNLATIKQQVAVEAAPAVYPAPPAPAPAGEGLPPHAYLAPPLPPHPAYQPQMVYGGSPMRARVSAPGALPPPPAWWWGGGGGGGGATHSPPRRAPPSLDSRSDDSRERRARRHHRNREAERENQNAKERSGSKVRASRSDRRHRK